VAGVNASAVAEPSADEACRAGGMPTLAAGRASAKIAVFRETDPSAPCSVCCADVRPRRRVRSKM